jgi:hypothetical protein
VKGQTYIAARGTQHDMQSQAPSAASSLASSMRCLHSDARSFFLAIFPDAGEHHS